MPTIIDETELARLEYLIEASESCGYSTKSDDPNMQYLAAACHYTPALVAEVRRLRAKVEAWEWYDECRRCVEWLDYGTSRPHKCWQPGQTLQPLPHKWATPAYRPQPQHMPT